MRLTTLLVLFLLSGCAHDDWKALLQDVKENCHTVIDAQLAATLTGVGGSGHFQQECWPVGQTPTHVPTLP